MKTINVSCFGQTTAFSTIAAFVEARQAGRNYVCSTDYPWLGASLESTHRTKNGRPAISLISHIEHKRTAIGYDIKTDLNGDILKKETIYRDVVYYYFNIDEVDKLIKDLQHPVNQVVIAANMLSMQKLLMV